MADLTFPYAPREWAKPVHKLLASASTRALVIVAGRRVGKTMLAVASLALAALHRPGNYGYIAPLRQSAKAIAWPILQELLRDVPGVEWRLSDLSVTVPTAGGGTSTIGMFGGADDDTGSSIRGRAFLGLVIDEAAQIGADAFYGSILPTQANLANPWMILIGTPRGIDLLYDLYHKANDTPGWHAFRIPASESGVYDPIELADLRRTMSPNLFQREMEASFDVADPSQLIALEDVRAAQARTAGEYLLRSLDGSFARIVGVDVALKADESVIARRQGPVVHEPIRIKNPTTQELAFRILNVVREWDADGLFIDAGSMGASVIDVCKQLGLNPIGVNFGGRSNEPQRYLNKRAEMLDKVREWTERSDAVLPPGEYVARQLTVSRFEFNAQNKLAIESKKEIRKRLGDNASTDFLDALALTFSASVQNPRLETTQDFAFGSARRRETDEAPLERAADGSTYTSSARTMSRRLQRAEHTYDPYDERYEEFDVFDVDTGPKRRGTQQRTAVTW